MTIARRKLPAVPKGVDVEKLRNNLKLYSEQEIRWLKSTFTENGRYREYVDAEGQQQRLTYPLFVFNGKYFVSYPGKEFHYGDQEGHCAKLAQDMDTGEWLVEKVLKVLPSDDDSSEFSVEPCDVDYERDISHARGMAVAVDGNAAYLFRPFSMLDRDLSDRVGKHYLFLQRKPGMNLHEWAEKDLPLVVRLEMTIALAGALIGCHRDGLLHRDVKGRNAVYDMIRDSMSLVDFGLAIRQEELSPDLYSDWGTPGYMAPEICDGGNRYSEMSDAYAFGVTIGVLWGLIDINEIEKNGEVGYEAKMREKSRIDLPDNLKNYLQGVVRSLTHSNPEKRESLEHVWNSLMRRYGALDESSRIINVAVVDAAGYAGVLQECDLVRLLDISGDLSDRNLLVIKQDMERKGFVVDDEVCVGPLTVVRKEIALANQNHESHGRIYRQSLACTENEMDLQDDRTDRINLTQVRNALTQPALVRRRVVMHGEREDVRIQMTSQMKYERVDGEGDDTHSLQVDTYDWGDWAVWFFGNMREDFCRMLDVTAGNSNSRNAGCFGLFGSCIPQGDDPLSPTVIHRAMREHNSDDEVYGGQEMARMGI